MFQALYEPDDRFEPRLTAFPECGKFFREVLLLGEDLLLPLLVLLRRKELVEVADHQPVELGLARLDLSANPVLRLRLSGDVVLLVFVQFLEHPVRPVVGNTDAVEDGRDLLCDRFLPHIRLRAVSFHSFGAVQVVVALLRFSRDETATLAAAKRAAVQVLLEPIQLLRLALAGHHLLALVEQCFADDRLVRALVLLAVIRESAVVDRVLEHAMDLSPRERLPFEPLAAAVGEPQGGHRFGELVEAVAARGVELEGFADERGALGVGTDRAGRLVVAVADRSDHRPDAVLELLPLTSLDVLGEGVDVILAHAEEHGERELALRGGLDVDRRELQVGDHAGIEQVDDPAAVEHVAGQTVRVPGEDGGGLALLDAGEHLVEDRPPRPLGALLLQQDVGDVQIMLSGKLPDLGELVLDAADLAVGVVGRFAGIDEEVGRRGVHPDIIP